jgi:hypothetical protein
LTFEPSRLEGDYALYDDGWRCSLSLRRRSRGGLEARFFSYERTTGAFDATVTVDRDVPHRLQIDVRGPFNELDHQTYSGYAFTRGPAGIAGVTDWKGQTFGFFALRQPPWDIGPTLPGTVTPTDFIGSYDLYCDGEHATLELSELDGATARGHVRERDGAVLPVEAEIDAGIPHHAVITVGDRSAAPPQFRVWMFVRPRTALAGWLDWDHARLGCYLLRFR